MPSSSLGCSRPEGEGCLSAMAVPWWGEGESLEKRKRGLVKRFLNPETYRFLKEPESVSGIHSFIQVLLEKIQQIMI